MVRTALSRQRGTGGPQSIRRRIDALKDPGIFRGYRWSPSCPDFKRINIFYEGKRQRRMNGVRCTRNPGFPFQRTNHAGGCFS
jgi:hypothetical protein